MNLVTELVIANRILATEDVVDAYGHVSVRNPEAPERFFLAHSKSPALIQAADIVEHTLDGQAHKPEQRPLYLERFIHAAIYEARPEVMAVVHAHAEDVLPFTITKAAQPRRDRRARRRHGLQAAVARDAARLAVLGTACRLRRTAEAALALQHAAHAARRVRHVSFVARDQMHVHVHARLACSFADIH